MPDPARDALVTTPGTRREAAEEVEAELAAVGELVEEGVVYHEQRRLFLRDDVGGTVLGIDEAQLAEVKAQEQLSRTKVVGNDLDPEPIDSSVEVKCPVTGRIGSRARTAADPIVWTHEAWARLQLVPLIARPLARNTVERFSRAHEIWRITTRVMDENKQAMIEADEFDMDTMLVMFNELRAKQIRAEAEGGAPALSPEMRQMIEEAKAAGITRCPIRDVEQKAAKCPVDLKLVKPQDAKAAVEELVRRGG